MDKIAQEQKRFDQFLKKSGLKNSSGRQKVFGKVMNSHGHFTAEELVKALANGQKNVSRATVYRSIKEMLEAGIIRKTAFGEKHEHYEHVYDEKLHHHARCIHCFEVIEFPCKSCDSAYLGILECHGFHVLGHEMHFYGTCKVCQKNENQSKRKEKI